MGLCLSSSDGRSETSSVSSMSLEKDCKPEAKCEHIEHIKFSKIAKQSQEQKSTSKKGESGAYPPKSVLIPPKEQKQIKNQANQAKNLC